MKVIFLHFYDEYQFKENLSRILHLEQSLGELSLESLDYYHSKVYILQTEAAPLQSHGLIDLDITN